MENLENQITEVIEKEDVKTGVKTFTEEEVNKLKQSAEDKVRTEYTKRIKALESELKEYKPKTLTEEEKSLQDKLKAIEDKEKELAKKEMEFKMAETLENNGLTKQLAKYLNLQGVEDIESYVGEVKEILNNHLTNNSFKPNKHSNNNNNTITKEEFKKMDYSKRIKLYNTNKELYNLLSK